MSFPTTIFQETEEDIFLVEQVALQCVPCGSGLSLAGNSCDASVASWELDGDIDSSFSSRSSTSPMAKALDIQDRLPLHLPTVHVQSKTKGRKGRKGRTGRPQLTPEQMAKLPCRFFQSKAGCRAGACCPYNHATL